MDMWAWNWRLLTNFAPAHFILSACLATTDLQAKMQRCYQDQGVRDQEQTKTRQAETETETKTREAETKTKTSKKWS